MQQIADWLEKLGMSEYAQRFAENGIGFAALRHLTDQDLKDIGVLLGHRRIMLAAIQELGSPAAAQPVTAELKPRDTAERRQVTVMFSDLVGSTALSARLDPEDMREIISAYHRCCAEQITKAGGFVAKYMGDGVLAYFGYPRAHEDDAERGVRAGLGLIEAVPTLRVAGHDAALQVRVGIATGLVVVGDLIGEGAAQEQGVVGETPNVAARLQVLAEPGKVVISHSTRRLTGGMFEYHDLGRQVLKGLSDPTQAWQVLGPSTVESRFEAQRGAVLTPLVGREEELKLLLRHWQQARAGEGSVVLISGEPGIGKSRIVQSVIERLGAEPYTRLRQFCSPHHQDTALHPTITQLERAAGLRRGDTHQERLEKLETVLAQATNDLSEVVPLVAALLSIPTEDRYPSLNLTPQKQKERTLAALMAQVEGLAAGQPVLMAIEDVHWIDPTSLELLGLLIDRVAKMPVLLIITFRPEFASPWTDRAHVTLLSLNRLSPPQRAQMIIRVTSGKRLPKEITDQIIDRTDGVPLFIEELTKAVVESGMIEATKGEYVVNAPGSPLSIPTSLHASLLARLDRLAPVREVAQLGAAIGRQFSHELISALALMPQQRLDDALSQLVGAELIFQSGTPPDAVYTFKHALVQDAAYSTLLRSRRQQLHAHIAATLERQFPEIVATQPQLMAQHCAEAGLADKAVGYSLKAGHQAVARSALAEAAAQLRKGLKLIAAIADSRSQLQYELDLQMALGPALLATKGFAASEVGDTFARARTLAEQLDRPEYQVPLLYGLRLYHTVRSEFELGLTFADKMTQIGEARADRAVQLLGLRCRGEVDLYMGDFVAARAFFEQCHDMRDPTIRAVYATVAAEEQYTVMLGQLSVTLTYLGYLDQARSLRNEALLEARRLKHPYALVVMLTFAYWAAIASRSAADAKQYADEQIALATEHGFEYYLGIARVTSGWSSVASGQASDGLALVEEGLAAARETGAVFSIAYCLMMLAQGYAAMGRPKEALKHLASATELVEKNDERVWEPELDTVRGELIAMMGDRVAAEEAFQRSLTVSRNVSAKLIELRASTRLARLWRDQGKRTEARELLAPIYGWFTEGFDTLDLKQGKALLDELTS
jgi:class 3 adenylate cyclase/tetratricopeptide (TPR) repeat protein